MVVSNILNGLSKINFGFIPGVFTGGELVGGSSQSRGTFTDFTLSEGDLGGAGSLVSGEHLVMFSLFIIDLVFELVQKVLDTGQRSSSLDLSFDLGK